MKLFSGEKVEIVLKPTDEESMRAIETARNLMAEKIDQWILDRLTIDQLRNCILKFQFELDRRKEK